jgi:general secretion pathway protein F
MPIYTYKGLNKRGKSVQGMLDTESTRSLRSELRKQDIFLTEYSEQSKDGKANQTIRARGRKQAGSREIEFRFFNRIPAQTVSEMTRQLSTLLRAGVPLVEALSAIVEQTEDERLAQIMAQIRRSVNEGMAMHLALREHPKTFPSLYCNMVSAGEASGTLELVFQRLADFMEAQVRLRSKVNSALMYPAIMIGFSGIIVTLLMTFVVPKLVEVIVEQGGNLPWITRALIWISEFFQNWLFALIAAAIFGSIRFRKWTQTESGELIWDTFKLKFPLFGDLQRKIVMARFARTLGTLMASSVPLLSALDIAKHVVDNAKYRNVIEDARVAIRDGDSIAAPLKRSGEFPAMVTQMIAIGEKTGEVEEMLENVAVAYETQVDTKVSRLTTLLEPVMIVVLGIIVACIVFAVLLPMLNMNEALRSGGV